MEQIKGVNQRVKKSKILGEFKEFITRGNVIDLAVGVIVGAAFQNIVQSLVNDLVMPFVGLATGGINFSDQFIVLNAKGVDYATAAAATEAGCAVFNYGSFITAVINFLIMAVIIFLMVKGINKLKRLGHKEEVVEEKVTTKICPYCKSEIALEATRCPHCTSEVE